MKYNKKGSEPSKGSGASASKSKAAKPAKAAPPDDLTQLSGIGPRISTILADGGVTTYAELEHTDPAQLRKIIAARRRAAAVQPRLVADPGVLRGAWRLVGSLDVQPQVAPASRAARHHGGPSGNGRASFDFRRVAAPGRS